MNSRFATNQPSRLTGYRVLTSVLGLLSLLLLASGCRMVQGVADAPGQAMRVVMPGQNGQPAAEPVEVQQVLLRFADEYAMRMSSGVDKLRHGTSPLSRTEVLEAKIALATETCSIASGPNAVAGLLDMTVFVTVTRMSLEDYWQPQVFGESAQPLLGYARSAETEIWRIAATVLTPEQQAELHRAIEAWHRQNPLPESVVATRGLGFASQIAPTSREAEARPGSVFSLLRVDPLAGMDPAVRELAETRLFAERALFVAQQMPRLLRWQTELLSANAVQLPAVQQLVTNSTQMADAVERFAAVAETLPAQVSSERAAIVQALAAQEKEVASLMISGTQMSGSLNTTLTTFDALMKRFGVGETNHVASPTAHTEPFRIQDYTDTAAQLEATARQLTELLVTLDQTIGSTNLAKLSGQVAPVVQQAQAGGKDVVDYAFRKGVLLVLIALVAALIYRLLATRMFPAQPRSTER